ncbi:two-component system sensor histidine kinase LiaS [Bacillaceae bacterium]
MVFRMMGQIILFSIVLFGMILYWMQSSGYLKPFASWIDALFFNMAAIAAIAVIAAMFGFFLSYKLKKRIEQLSNAVLQMEKGNLSRRLPDLGRDEIGQLAEQLARMSVKWEEQVNSLQRLSTHNARLAEKVRLTAIMEERQRLARELHDAVSQQLFAISMTAAAVSRSLEKDYEQAKRQIRLITEMASAAQSEMRALLLHLRPVHLEGKGLVQALQELIAEMKEKVPMEISFETDEEIRLLKGIEDHLFRIVQEALSNTLRHAKATKMEVKLQQRNNVLRLMIRDNGIGFDLKMKKKASYGLQTIQERVNEIGGSLQILTAPGKGTKMEIRIPVLNEESERKGGDRDGSTDQSAAGG